MRSKLFLFLETSCYTVAMTYKVFTRLCVNELLLLKYGPFTFAKVNMHDLCQNIRI